MCFKSPKIPGPDPAIGQATLRQIQLAEREYNDYVAPGGDRDFYRGITSEVMDQMRIGSQQSERLLGAQMREMETADQVQHYQLGQQQAHDQRYWGVAVPYEDRLRNQIDEYDSEGFRENQVTRALADTQMQFDNARQGGIRSMTRRGASPESGAYGAMMNDGGRAQALAMATAANKTRLAAQQVGLSNKLQMYGGMKGLAGLGATSAQLAIGAGGLAVTAGQGAGSAIGQGMNAAGGLQGAAGNYLGANNAASGVRNQGMSAGISGYNQMYGNQVNAAIGAANAKSEVLGAGIGAVGTAAAAYFI
jgi:hypothetical protein